LDGKIGTELLILRDLKRAAEIGLSAGEIIIDVLTASVFRIPGGWSASRKEQPDIQ
jgi:hypothetical protein